MSVRRVGAIANVCAALLGPRATMRWLCILAVALFLAGSADAKRTAVEPRFPASVSEQVIRELVTVGRVEPVVGREQDATLRWGAASLDQQESSMRAVIRALLGRRPPLGVAAAILAIARVESGWNAESRNPTSSACGLFQFIRETWESYGGARENCDDPALNACLGVEHLTTLYQAHVQPRLGPLTLVTTELERLEWTYRMLYAYHYHGEDAVVTAGGGALVAQSAAETSLPQLKSFFSILKKATVVTRAPARRPKRRRARG